MVVAHVTEQNATDAVSAFAQQLGILPHEEEHFQWLAEVGLQSPLPSRWTSHADAHTGFMYYIDHDRQISSWENPLVPHLRRVVEIGRAYLQRRTETFFEDQKALLWHQHKNDLDSWHGPFADDEGRSYFVNAALGISSWNDPRVDAQYIFELEGGLLATLAEVLPVPESRLSVSGGMDLPCKAASGSLSSSLDHSAKIDFDHSIKSKTRLGRNLNETMKKWTKHNKRDEHNSVLEEMAHTATLVRNALKDEEECQRLQFSRKIECRRQRRQPQACQISSLSSSFINNALHISLATEAAVTKSPEMLGNGHFETCDTVSQTTVKSRSRTTDFPLMTCSENLLTFGSMEVGLVVGVVR